MSPSSSKPSRPPRPDRPLLSTSTVLILSGFVLGLSVGGRLPESMQVITSIGGLTGLIAFIGLDHLASRRRASARRREQDYFQNRLMRHLEDRQGSTIDVDELLELARQATSTCELTDRPSARKPMAVACQQRS